MVAGEPFSFRMLSDFVLCCLLFWWLNHKTSKCPKDSDDHPRCYKCAVFKWVTHSSDTTWPRKSCEWHQTLNLTFAPPSGQGGDAAGGADDQEDDDCGRAAHRSLQTGWGDLFAAHICRFTVKATSKCDTFSSVGTLRMFLSVTPLFVVNSSCKTFIPFCQYFKDTF